MRRYIPPLPLTAILLYALITRSWEAQSGLPYMVHWDEPQTAVTALTMLQEGHWLPGFYNYGSGLIYLSLAVDFLVYFKLMGTPGGLTHLSDLTVGDYFISHPTFLLANRLIVVLMAVAAVALVYLVAARLSNRWTALFGAAVLATSWEHLEASGRLLNDVPVATLALLVVYLSLLYLERGELSFAVVALLAAGMAGGFKYYAVLAGVVPLVALGLRPPARWWLWLLLPLLPVVGFLVVVPGVLLETRAFLDGAGFEVYHYAVLGNPGGESAPGWPHLSLQLRRIVLAQGWTVSLLALAGAGRLLWLGRRGWLVLLWPLLFAAYMSNTIVTWHRNWLSLYVFSGVLAAAGLYGLWEIARWVAPLRLRPWATVAAAACAVALTVWTGGHSAVAARAALQPETRTVAVDKLNAMAARMVGVPAELQVHPQDLARLRHPYTLAPLADLLADPSCCDVVLLPRHIAARKPANKAVAAALTAQVAELQPQWRVLVRGREGTYLDRFSQYPTVLLWRPAVPSADRGSVSP